MSSLSLTATYSGGAAVVDPWWVALEQLPVTDDVATVEDTAVLLDTLFDIDPCTATETDTDAGQSLSVLDTDAVVEAAATAFDIAICTEDPDGSVEVQVKVIRSHQGEDYRLHVAGGSVLATIVTQEELTLTTTVSSATSVTLDYPVIDQFSCSWMGDLVTESGTTPTITRTGNTLSWNEAATGTITATFVTVYDLVTIVVDGIDGEQGAATIRVVFHGLVEDLVAELPSSYEADRSLCPSVVWQGPTSNDEVTCYNLVTVHKLCSCSKEEIDAYTYQQVVSCPEDMRCPNNETRCMHLLGSKSVNEYVDCGDTDRSGTFDGKLDDPEFYQKKCCEAPTVPLPSCVSETTSYRGGVAIAEGAAFYKNIYGPKTRIVPVAPSGGICGTHTITQALLGNNCCDGVELLGWDDATSPEVIAPNSQIIIGVTGGGKYSYTWMVVGTGFQFDNGAKTMTTSDNQVRLWAVAEACGTAEITVTDGCSECAGAIRSTAGVWAGACYAATFVTLSDPDIGGAYPFARSNTICGFPTGTGGLVLGVERVLQTTRLYRWDPVNNSWQLVNTLNQHLPLADVAWLQSSVQCPLYIGVYTPQGPPEDHVCLGGDACRWVCG